MLEHSICISTLILFIPSIVVALCSFLTYIIQPPCNRCVRQKYDSKQYPGKLAAANASVVNQVSVKHRISGWISLVNISNSPILLINDCTLRWNMCKVAFVSLFVGVIDKDDFILLVTGFRSKKFVQVNTLRPYFRITYSSVVVTVNC